MRIKDWDERTRRPYRFSSTASHSFAFLLEFARIQRVHRPKTSLTRLNCYEAICCANGVLFCTYFFTLVMCLCVCVCVWVRYLFLRWLPNLFVLRICWNWRSFVIEIVSDAQTSGSNFVQLHSTFNNNYNAYNYRIYFCIFMDILMVSIVWSSKIWTGTSINHNVFSQMIWAFSVPTPPMLRTGYSFLKITHSIPRAEHSSIMRCEQKCYHICMHLMEQRNSSSYGICVSIIDDYWLVVEIHSWQIWCLIARIAIGDGPRQIWVNCTKIRARILLFHWLFVRQLEIAKLLFRCTQSE